MPEILDGVPVGVALDAACGTGRHAAYLASLGHAVIGAHPRERVRATSARRYDVRRAVFAMPYVASAFTPSATSRATSP